jgi:hypothetical protein
MPISLIAGAVEQALYQAAAPDLIIADTRQSPTLDTTVPGAGEHNRPAIRRARVSTWTLVVRTGRDHGYHGDGRQPGVCAVRSRQLGHSQLESGNAAYLPRDRECVAHARA